MYGSIFLLPSMQLGFALINRVRGPKRTRQISRFLGHFLCAVCPKTNAEFRPETLRWELCWIRLATPRRWVQCLETACAFEQWLALHGTPSRVCIGRRVEGDAVLMHAWVQTREAQFFYDARFEPCFEGI